MKDKDKKEFFEMFANIHPGDSGIGGNDPQEPVCEWIDPIEDHPGIIWQWIERNRDKLVNDICLIIEDIESKDDNNSLEQWKQYKHIRNTIRDIFLKTQL